MGTTIGERVATALPDGVTHREIAARVGMTPDAFSRSLSGARGFAALELARLAELCGADLHFLITGETDPHAVRQAARHEFDPVTRRRTLPGEKDDAQILDDIRLAYRQAGEARLAPSVLPTSVAQARTALGQDFVRPFVERLEAVGIDVVRVPGLSTAYTFVIDQRAVIVLAATANWFNENWGLAHELGHLALGHCESSTEQTVATEHDEARANAFAAELLLPTDEMRRIDWASTDERALAQTIWDRGVSIKALANRLKTLGLTCPELAHWIDAPTQKLLRRALPELSRPVDHITPRMTDAAARHFPAALEDAHLELIARGRLRKDTLAWMLDVDPDTLEVEQPDQVPSLTVDELADELGI